MMRKLHTEKHYILLGDFFDTKIREYFNFAEFEFMFRESYELPTIDTRIIDILKQTDL